MDEQLTQVLSILVQGTEMGQRAGAFDLKTAGVIAQAVEIAKERIEKFTSETSKAGVGSTPKMEVEEKPKAKK